MPRSRLVPFGTVGGRMPLNGTALDNIDLTNIKNWINNGAPNN